MMFFVGVRCMVVEAHEVLSLLMRTFAVLFLGYLVLTCQIGLLVIYAPRCMYWGRFSRLPDNSLEYTNNTTQV